ncbi:MAG TPA: alcohol dehydrogenase catalytic domain-containing protein, partial [Gammaproteobacteria bacterium]
QFRADVPPPVPVGTEVAIRVLRAGICGTDAALVDGMYQFAGIPGHEFVGVAIGGSDEIRDHRVVGEINISCGVCPACVRGHRKHCARRKALGVRNHHGAFAEFLVLPIENLHLVPDSVPDDAAVFVEPIAAALDILDQVEVRPDQRVLVVGDGKLGQLVCRVVALSGASVDVAGRYPDKLRRLAGVAGNTYEHGTFERRGYDIAVECTGNPTGLSAAVDALRPQGTLVIKSTFFGPVEVDTSRIVVDELRVLGSRCGRFEAALALLDKGRVDPLPLIDGRFPLENALDGFRKSREPGVLKILLDFD